MSILTKIKNKLFEKDTLKAEKKYNELKEEKGVIAEQYKKIKKRTKDAKDIFYELVSRDLHNVIREKKERTMVMAQKTANIIKTNYNKSAQRISETVERADLKNKSKKAANIIKTNYNKSAQRISEAVERVDLKNKSKKAANIIKTNYNKSAQRISEAVEKADLKNKSKKATEAITKNAEKGKEVISSTVTKGKEIVKNLKVTDNFKRVAAAAMAFVVIGTSSAAISSTMKGKTKESDKQSISTITDDYLPSDGEFFKNQDLPQIVKAPMTSRIMYDANTGKNYNFVTFAPKYDKKGQMKGDFKEVVDEVSKNNLPSFIMYKPQTDNIEDVKRATEDIKEMCNTLDVAYPITIDLDSLDEKVTDLNSSNVEVVNEFINNLDGNTYFTAVSGHQEQVDAIVKNAKDKEVIRQTDKFIVSDYNIQLCGYNGIYSKNNSQFNFKKDYPNIISGNYNNASSQDKSDEISVLSESAVVIDAETGEVIYSKNMDKKMYAASSVKAVTDCVVLEYGDLNDKVKYSSTALNIEGHPNYGYQIGGFNSKYGYIVQEGNEITLEDAIQLCTKRSENITAIALKEYIEHKTGGDFEELMSEIAKKAGCSGDFSFTNPFGFAEDKDTLKEGDNYGDGVISAYDLALILKYGLSQSYGEELKKALDKEPYSMESFDQVIEHSECGNYYNEDAPYYDPAIKACKTGYTDKSGWTGITYCEDENGKYIIVTMNHRNKGNYVDENVLSNYAKKRLAEKKVAEEATKNDIIYSESNTTKEEETNTSTQTENVNQETQTTQSTPQATTIEIKGEEKITSYKEMMDNKTGSKYINFELALKYDENGKLTGDYKKELEEIKAKNLPVMITYKPQNDSIADVHLSCRVIKNIMNELNVEYPVVYDMTAVVNNEKLNGYSGINENNEKMLRYFINYLKNNNICCAALGTTTQFSNARENINDKDLIDELIKFAVNDSNNSCDGTFINGEYSFNTNMKNYINENNLNNPNNFVNECIYVIKENDTYESIAKEFNISNPENIRVINHNKELVKGESLEIPFVVSKYLNLIDISENNPATIWSDITANTTNGAIIRLINTCKFYGDNITNSIDSRALEHISNCEEKQIPYTFYAYCQIPTDIGRKIVEKNNSEGDARCELQEKIYEELEEHAKNEVQWFVNSIPDQDKLKSYSNVLFYDYEGRIGQEIITNPKADYDGGFYSLSNEELIRFIKIQKKETEKLGYRYGCYINGNTYDRIKDLLLSDSELNDENPVVVWIAGGGAYYGSGIEFELGEVKTPGSNVIYNKYQEYNENNTTPIENPEIFQFTSDGNIVDSEGVSRRLDVDIISEKAFEKIFDEYVKENYPTYIDQNNIVYDIYQEKPLVKTR